MSIIDRPEWYHHGGFYRSVDLNVPWVASPQYHAKPIPPTFVQFQPITVLPPSLDYSKSITSSKKKQRGFNVFQILKEWMGDGTRVIYGASPSEETPQAPPMEVSMDEWKAWGYFARPTVEGVEVQNYPSTTPPPPSLTLQEVVSRLRSPGKSAGHPERWIPGLEHPSLPPRPSRWIESKPGEPLPFPWECQLNPFLQHLPYGPPPLCWNLGKPPSGVMFGKTEAAIPLNAADKAQPATWPFVTHMYINAIAEDPVPTFRWPFMVFNPRGITCGDVFETIYQNFQEHVSASEYQSWEDIRQRPASLAFQARNGGIHNDRLRRVDVLGTHHMFRGLAPHPNREGWTMFVGLA